MAAKTTLSKEIKEKTKAEQKRSEDKSFYSMLAAFAASLVIELALVTIYRKYYAGAYYGNTLRIIMFVFLGITAAAGIAFIALAAMQKFKYLKPLFATGFIFFAMAVQIRHINTIGILAIKFGCFAFPVMLVLFLIYMIYQPEFFITALLGTAGMAAAWLARTSFSIPLLFKTRNIYLIVAVALVVLTAAFVLLVKLNKGCIGSGKWRVRVFEPKTSYKAIFITIAVIFVLTAALLVSELMLVGFARLYKIVILLLAAYVLGTGIYYTIKLM